MAWTRQRTDFKLDEFYRRIEQMGYALQWEKSALCPCLDKNRTGQSDFNCPLCKGKGRYWYDQQVVKGVMTSLSGKGNYPVTGEVMTGTSYFTTHGWNKLGLWDRLTHVNSKMRYSEILTKKGAGEKDQLRFKPMLQADGFPDILNVRTVEKEYYPAVDFTMDTTGFIEWISGSNQPRTGDQFTVDYYSNPRWIVIDLINIVRDTFVKSKRPGVTFLQLPVRSMVRLEYYVQVYF
jgi:hypothetical protein